MVKLLLNWQSSEIPVLLSAKNQTHADGFKQLLEDLGVESTTAGDQLTTNRCPWLDWIEKNNTENTSGSIPILTGKVSSGFRKLDSNGKALFVLLTEEEVFGEKTRSRRLQRAQVQKNVGNLDDLREGDYVVHLDYGIGRFQGLKKIAAGCSQNEFMQLVFASDEKVYVPVGKFYLVQKYVNAEGNIPIEPVSIAASSLIMSPKRFPVRITSN